MFKKIQLLGVLLAIPLFSFAQFWEVGLFGGISTYVGDLTPDPIEFSQMHPAYGALVRYNLNKKWTLKGNAYFGTISGSDAQDAKSDASKARNLSFKSYIYDFSGQIEWNILGIQAGYKKDRFSPYLFLGLSVFSFDPTANLNGEDVRLQPLGTEGQETTKYNDRQKYALTQIGIPFGVGLKFNLGNAFNIGLETGIRKTFTDYLDDVSTTYPVTGYLKRNSQGGVLAEQLSNRSVLMADGKPSIYVTDGKSVARGNPDNKDWYLFSGVTVTYTFLRPACPRW